MPEITLEHVRQAAEWAAQASEPSQLDGLVRSYSQSTWDCGTACCMWGAASILAGNGPATAGPPKDWAARDHRHTLIAGLLNSQYSRPEQVQELLAGADLSGADLSRASLAGASLSGASLSGADLAGADLSGADLSRADLSGADLSGADLSGADLAGADLAGADLSGADLSRADLSGASLSGADLSGADLAGADLSGADLAGALVSVGNAARRLGDKD